MKANKVRPKMCFMVIPVRREVLTPMMGRIYNNINRSTYLYLTHILSVIENNSDTACYYNMARIKVSNI